MLKTGRVIIVSFLILIIALLFPIKVFATDSGTDDSAKIGIGIIDPGDFEPEKPDESEIGPILDSANVIIGLIKVVGIVVIVVTLMVLGIKYMMGTVSEKAEYKKTMIPYFIGAFIFFAVTQIIGIIADAVADI